MTQKLIVWLVVVGITGCAIADASGQSSAEKGTATGSARAEPVVPTDDQASVTMSIRQTEPTTIVYSEYAGPYWGIGPVLRRVHADMAVANIRGATFIRFPSDPRGKSTVPEATRVGYFAKPGVRPTGHYLVEHWKSALVVTTTVRGSNTSTHLLYPQMRAWASSNGYTPIGPIIEVFEPMSLGATIDDQRTEIRMPVQSLDVVDAPVPQSDNTKRETATETMVEPVALERPRKTKDAVVDVPQPTPQDRLEDVVTNPVDESKHPMRREPDVIVSTSAQPTFTALINGGKYAEALVAVWPRSARLDPESLRWLGSVTMRVSAIAAAFADQGTESSRRIEAMADAMIATGHRLSVESDGSGNASPPEPGIRSDHRDILQTLDRLMGRIGQRRVEAVQCLAELDQILSLLHKTRND